MIDLDLLRGGAATWAVSINNGAYFVRNKALISITGLSQECAFTGAYSSATVEIRLFLSGDLPSVGATVTISLNGTPLWSGTLSSAQRETEGSVLLMAKGSISSLSDDYELYWPVAFEPKNAVLAWAEYNSGTSVFSPSYTDDYYRNYAKVAPPSSTLSGLLPYEYFAPTMKGIRAKWDVNLKCYVEDEQNFGTVQNWGSVIRVNAFSPVPSGSVYSPGGKSIDTIAWHKKNATITVRCAFGNVADPIFKALTAPAVCDWYVGGDKYLSFYEVTLTPADGTAAINEPLYEATAEPASEEKKWIKAYDRKMAPLLGKVPAYLLRMTGRSPMVFHRVTQAVYNGTICRYAKILTTLFPQHSRDFIFDSKDFRNVFDFSDCLIGRAKNTVSVEPLGASINFDYVHPNTQYWSYPSASESVAPYDQYVQYFIRQPFNLMSINQSPWDKTRVIEASFLGGVCLSEQFTIVDDYYQYGMSIVDLYPERGHIFEVPLTLSTVADWAWVQDNPLPSSYHISTTDACGNDFQTEYNAGEGEGEQDISIMSGILYGDSIEFSSYTNRAAGSTPVTVLQGVLNSHSNGELLDRFSGVRHLGDGSDGGFLELRPPVPVSFDYDIDPVTGDRVYPLSAGALYGFCWLRADGTMYDGLCTPYSGDTAQSSDDFNLPGYSVRGADGNNYCLFGDSLHIPTTMGQSISKSWRTNQDFTLLDSFPLCSMRMASQRVYKLPNRPIYSCHAPLLFATVPLGSVLLVQLPMWQDNEPWLALLMGKSYGTHDSVTIKVAPMRPLSEYTSQRWDNWDAMQKLVVALSEKPLVTKPSTELRSFPLVPERFTSGVLRFLVPPDVQSVFYGASPERWSLQLVKDSTIYSFPCVSGQGNPSFLSEPYGGVNAIKLSSSLGLYFSPVSGTDLTTTFLADYLNADKSYKEGCLIQLVIDDTNTYDLPPLPPPPPTPTWHLISGTEVTPTKTTAQYYNCHQFEVNGSTRLSGTLDITKGLFVEINGEAFFSPSFEGPLKTVLNASNGFPRATTSAWTTSYPNNWGAGGVYLVNNRSRSVQEWYLTDEMYEKFNNDEVTIRVWYNAEAELY